MLTTPGGRPTSCADLGEEQRGERGELGGLEHHRVAHRQRGRDLPGQHQQREVPGDDLPDHADRHPVGQLALHQLRPAGVVVEVAGHQRDVDVARLADRLAVVERLEHGEEPAVLLDLARDGVEVARAPVPAERPPVRAAPRARPRPRGPRRPRVAWATRASGLPVAGFSVSKVSPAPVGPLAADEEPEPPAVRVEPRVRRRRRFGRGAVLHRLEDLGDGCHGASSVIERSEDPQCQGPRCARISGHHAGCR